MASTSLILQLVLLARGESAIGAFPSWAEVNNANLTSLEAAVGEQTSITLAAVDAVLTTTQERSMHLLLTGALSANVAVRTSGRKGFWIATNNTTGAYTVTVKPNAGDGVVVRRGDSVLLYCDGTKIFQFPSPERSFVADGDIDAGDVVALQTDGTIAPVNGTGLPEGTGPAAVYESASTTYTAIAFDAANGKVVVAYRDTPNSNYGTAVVGTVSGQNITFGTPAVFEAAATNTIALAYDSANQKVLIAYSDGGNSQYGTAIVGTVSGNSISFGAAAVFESAASIVYDMTFEANAGRFVIVYSDDGNSGYGTAVVATISGTSVSFGTPVVFKAAAAIYVAIAFDSAHNKVVIAYTDPSNSNYGTAVVGTVSGTSISFGTAVVYVNNIIRYTDMTFDPQSGKVVVTYQDGGNSNYGTAIVGTVSGTSISFGLPAVFVGSRAENTSVTFDTVNHKAIVAYIDYNNSSYGAVVAGSITGTTIGFDVPLYFESASISVPAICWDSTHEKAVIAYPDVGNGNFGTAIVFNVDTQLTNANAWIGIASMDIEDGDLGMISMLGQINRNQSALTAGASYYLATDGTISTINTGRRLGRALSTTELLIEADAR